MKRLAALLIALMFVLSGICAAAAEENVFSTAYFTLTLPEDWIIDMEDLESEENAQELGYFGDPLGSGILATACLIYYEDLKNIALWSSDADELQAYAEAVLEDFADDNPEWLGTVMAGSIPFVLIRGTDEDGEYLYADTLTNGYAVEFFVYRLDEEAENMIPFEEEQIELFKSVLTTFKPVT